MDRGLYIAASGMLAEMARQDLLANDLANASTAGYKSDRATQRSFAEVLLTNTQTGAVVGPVGTGAAITRQATDLSSAPIKETGEPLDFAITGDGFFAVQTAQGTRYTRNGQFAVDAQGRLVSNAGDPVLDANGRTITATNGTVDPRRIGVVALTNPVKQGDSLVTGTPAGAANGTVRSGALEGSGADPARSMVDMIDSMRAFEAGQKVIQAIDETLGKAATQVGSTS